VITDISGEELVHTLGLEKDPWLFLLPELLDGEPATGHGHQVGGGTWQHRPSKFLRRFQGINTVGEYVARVRSWYIPPTPQQPDVARSPLGIAASFDYLDVVWQLRFGTRLVQLPSAERVTRLAFDPSTAEEFDSRMSVLGEFLKGLQVPPAPGVTGDHPIKRLAPFLRQHLAIEAIPRIEWATEILEAVVLVRNAGQHSYASERILVSLSRLGLSYPIEDHRTGWGAVGERVVAALTALREEIRQ
jgi:hypothetical protein